MVLKKVKEEQSLRKEIKERTVGYILAAFGLVAGLAWNEAIKGLIDQFFPNSGSVAIKFIYAVIVTIIIVLVSVYLVRLTGKKEKNIIDR